MWPTLYSFPNPFFSHPYTQDSRFSDLESFDDLISFLEESSLDEWINRKKEIKDFISQSSEDLDQLDEFLQYMTEKGIERNSEKMIDFLSDILTVDILTDVVCFKQKNSDTPFCDVFDFAYENAPLCPKPIDNSALSHFQTEWKKCRSIVINFIPNIINIFLGAFNFLDSHKKFTSLWEKHLLLEMVYKFFIIPYCLVKLLQPVFVVTAKVYFVAVLTIIGVGILIRSYQRWLRPIPDEIANCTNLDKQMENGFIESKVGQIKEIEELKAALEVDSNVLLIGASGEGKTALMHHLIQLKGKGELSDKLQQLTAYEVDCGLMISSLNYGHSELINQIKDQIDLDGFDGKILLFFDEFYQIVANHSAFQAFKKRFLEDKPQAKFVATMTFKEFEKLKKLDIDGSFRRRIHPIVIHASSEEESNAQNRLIIQDFINRTAKDLPITEDAIEAALDVSLQEDYLPKIGRPAKAIKILTDAIGLCRMVYQPHYVSTELSQARQDYEILKLQITREVKATPEKLKKIRKIKKKIEKIEKELNQNKKQVQKIKKIISYQQKMSTDYYRLTHLLAKAVVKPQQEDVQEFDAIEDSFFEEKKLKPKKLPKPQLSKKAISKKDQILYLWYYFYGLDALKKFLNQEIEKVDPEIPVQIDESLIYRVYEDSKQIEKNLRSDLQKDEEDEAKPFDNDEDD